ncbi:NfrA family protein [Aeromonas sp. Marseille-Q5825]|uniref:NfrA family protein n=1 Tax=Aeromonas sp. Marseille-Q5825 TaxID=2972767 RepID=UPI0021C77CF6|nr:tetratricopeptide repeat protein [Aeromonas sp. Marseille-Q5825]
MRPTLLLLSGLLLSQGGLAAQVEYDLGPDVSNYQRFVLYPHLQKGFSALERGHRDRAIAEFEQARRLQPRNPVITLYLARAYERFGEEPRALALVREQLAITPDDGELLAFAEAVQRKHPLDPACKLLECKVARADRDLQDGDLVGLTAALADPALARSTEGMGLRRNLLQRALGEQNWALAQAQFAWFEDAGTLSQGERKQWVTMLLAQGKLEQAIALRRRLPSQDGELDLAIALALGKDQRGATLDRYQQAHAPQFQRADQEREWLQLAANNQTLDSDETLQFAENQGFYAGLMLPVLRREGRWAELDRLLAMAPAQGNAELAFESALHQRQWNKLASEGRQLIRSSRQPMATLEQVSYRLQQAGLTAASRALLIEYWPYRGATQAGRETLIRRLSALQETPGAGPLPARLAVPLSDPDLRSLQASLLARAGQCDGVRQVLGDLSSRYDTSSWRALGACYRQDKPGLAEYAFARAASFGLPQDVRQLAYQAYENRHFDAALHAWQQLVLAPEEQEQMAAIRSALDAGDLPQARQWLNQYRAAGLPLGADYWRALARTQEDEQAIASLQRVIAMAPEARDYAALAQHQQRLGNKIEARDALHAANGLEPDNREYQLAYGYALLGNDERQAASDWLEGVYREGDTQLAEQLAYINQSLARNQKARDYASKAIDGEPPAQVSYDLRRLHEDLGRRWTVSVDAWTGTGQGTVSGIGGNAVAQSYAQTELEYRLGDEPIRDGKTLSLYGRLYGSSQSQRIYHLDEGSPDDGTYVEGSGGNPLDFRDPTLGVGVRWKPFRSQALFFAAEELLPLNSSQGGEHDTLIRASTSFLNDGKYSDEWHVGESGWWAQNLYLDAARYLRSRQTSLVADYRLSYHHKIHLGDTLEPYGHVQGRQYWNDKSPDTGYYSQNGETLAYSSGSDDYSLLMGGVGVRWNHWFGETRYDAWPHKLSLGIEYQRRLKSDPAIREIESGKAYDKDTLMMTMGVRW